jgi:hypothetical protein
MKNDVEGDAEVDFEGPRGGAPPRDVLDLVGEGNLAFEGIGISIGGLETRATWGIGLSRGVGVESVGNEMDAVRDGATR